MASVGRTSFGHASIQRSIVSHPQRPFSLFTFSRKPVPRSSRESRINRSSFTRAAGPKYSGSREATGQAPKQDAQRMQLTNWSIRLRSSSLCAISFGGGHGDSRWKHKSRFSPSRTSNFESQIIARVFAASVLQTSSRRCSGAVGFPLWLLWFRVALS